MPKLYTTQLFPTSAESISEQAGYPIANILRPALARPWRALTANPTIGAEQVNINLGANKLVRGVLVHDCNAVSLRIDTYNAASVLQSSTNSVQAANRHGRYRSVCAHNVTVDRVIIQPYGGTNDGLGYYRMGAAYVFGSVYTPMLPEYGLKVSTTFPQVASNLQNDSDAVAYTGFARDRLNGTFGLKNTDNANALYSDLRNGVCCLDFEDTLNPAKVWPLRMTVKNVDEALDEFNFSKLGFEATEQA